MLHQSLPLYEGNQPFIYAFYCAEDDDIAFPVLARMYNEGFRIWCASAGGVANDFRTIQRMNASASIMLFLSKNMLELIRMSDAEAVAAAKNPRLHITVSVDGAKADRSMWALAVPDELEYTPGNDAAFWLYMYTSDKLEKCRGPWPEKKIQYRDSGYDGVPERALQEEYRKLETIIMNDSSDTADGSESAGAQAEPADPQTRAAYETSDSPFARKYKNNAGYIAPEPDNYVYAPLGRIEVTKSEEEKEFDAFIGYLDRCVQEEERSVAEQEADRKYVSRQAVSDPADGDTVVDISVSEDRQSAYSSPLSPALAMTEESAGDTRSPREPVQPSPDKKDNAEPPAAKADRVIAVDDRLSAEDLSPEARRRRMYENGMLDKVLDPNDIDAVIQKRKKEERLKAEEEEREENEKAAAQAAELSAREEAEDNTGSDTSDAQRESVQDSGEEEQKASPSSMEGSGGRSPQKDAYKNSAGISEASLENMIDRSDIPEFADGMPSPEQLAAAPTYIMIPPSGGTPIDAPACLKLIEADGGMIAVPVPEEMSAGAAGSDIRPSAAADDGADGGVISDDMLTGLGISAAGTLSGYDSLLDRSDKKRHTVARKIISRKRSGVKVTPVKCEILRSLPQRDSDAGHHFTRRGLEDNSASYESAPSAENGQSGAGEETTAASMRKFRSRPMTAAEEQAASEANARSDTYSPYSGPDEMVEELEPRQSHRKNRHPHSQNGLLANVIAMLSRGFGGNNAAADTVAATAATEESGETFSGDEQVVSDETSLPAEKAGEAPSGDPDIMSLTAAVEKFIEAAPLEPVLVVPRRK